MDNQSKLLLVKSVHTAVWILFNLVLVYLFYAALTDQIDIKFWLGMGAIIIECIILVANNWTCPLSPWARRYTQSTRANFDIFLPNWIAKNNIVIYSTVFAFLILIILAKKVFAL